MKKTLLLLFLCTSYISLNALHYSNVSSCNVSAKEATAYYNTTLKPEKNPPYLSEERIQEIAGMLSDNPQGIGVTYKDRKFWKQFQKDQKAISLLKEAERSMKEGMPPFVDSLYLDLLSSGVRLPGENMMNARYQYVWRLALAECLENKKRFIPAIEEGIRELCKQKPWSIPAHDRNLNNYNGTEYYVDLVVATAANTLAQCIYMLDDKISEQTRKMVGETLKEKVFDPVKRCMEEQQLWFWFTVKNNWNSVCLAGVTGAALTLLPDKKERAFFVAVAERFHTYGMEGYGDDGYCSEGVGYYNYGFRAFILLREEICRATQGGIDFFATPKFARIAQYGRNIQINPGVSPAYSDCRIGLIPDFTIVNYCDNALGTEVYKEYYNFPKLDNLSLYLIEFFPNQAWPVKKVDGMEEVLRQTNDRLRTYYELSQVLIARPLPESDCRLGISLKAGHNAENHNHNDVGSYTVALGKETMLGDQGGPFSYPGDFFARWAYERYKSKGSYGHPVPRVNGNAQKTGGKAHGEILKKGFTDKKDIYHINMAPAYPDSLRNTVVREFEYDREGTGQFMVSDSFTAENAIAFETAITTRSNWTIQDNNTILLSSGEEELLITIEASAKADFIIETIEENAPAYTRIGIRLTNKTETGYIRLMMKPLT